MHIKEFAPYLSRIRTEFFVQETHKKYANAQATCGWRLMATILSAPAFDYMMGLFIIANMCVMIVETDQSASEQDPSSSIVEFTEIFGWVALLVFVLELLMRLLVLGCKFWRDPWNVFDFIIVTTDFVFSIVGLVASDIFPVSVLRIFRLAKLARVSKVLRVFPELRLLLAGLVSSMSSIFWGTVLLAFCLLVWSMVAVLFIHPLNQTIVYDGCDRCPRAYSTVMHASLTFWQQIVTGDSWGQATIPVIEKYPGTLFFFVPLFLSVGMAVLNLILGVVVSVAQEAKEELEEEDNAEKAFFKLKKQTQLLQLCKQMDSDNSGTLTHDEVYNGIDEPGEFQDMITSLGVSKQDFDIVWSILDADKHGSVSYKDLVNHLCTMRSSDTQFMLAYVKFYITSIKNTILQQMQNNHEEAMYMKRVMELEENILQEEEQLLKELHVSTPKRSRPTGDTREEEEEEDRKTRGSNTLDTNQVRFEFVSDHPDEITELDALTAAALSATPALGVHDEKWFKEVCHDIDMLRAQLKETLLDFNHKHGPRFSPTFPDDGIRSAKMRPCLPANLNKRSGSKMSVSSSHTLRSCSLPSRVREQDRSSTQGSIDFWDIPAEKYVCTI